jgi:hypothetical protein
MTAVQRFIIAVMLLMMTLLGIFAFSDSTDCALVELRHSIYSDSACLQISCDMRATEAKLSSGA